MILATKLREGNTIDMDGRILRVLHADHHMGVGRGSALIRTKLRDIINGESFDKTFDPEDRLETARLEKRPHNYMWTDGELYHFLDNETYEERELTREQIGADLGWLKEGEDLYVTVYEDRIIGLELPNTVDRKVIYTEPGLKGDTAQGGNKPATIEGGIKVTVPLFIENEEVITVNTLTGEYVTRAK
ncbi:MAG TPA: elongation factor P [Armatimonadota bacterium]